MTVDYAGFAAKHPYGVYEALWNGNEWIMTGEPVWRFASMLCAAETVNFWSNRQGQTERRQLYLLPDNAPAYYGPSECRQLVDGPFTEEV